MKNAIRSIKYFALLVLIFIVVSQFMRFTGSLDMTLEEQMALYMSNNGWVKILLIVAISILYPYFGYIKRDVEGSIVEDREQVVMAMESSGFVLKSASDDKLTFVANNIFRRVTFLFEDEVVVTQLQESIHFEGVRRGVAYAVYALDGLLKNKRENSK